MTNLKYRILRFFEDIHYRIFEFLAKEQIREVYERMELDVRTEFFTRICPEKKDKFDEAYEKVWVPLYRDVDLPLARDREY